MPRAAAARDNDDKFAADMAAVAADLRSLKDILEAERRQTASAAVVTSRVTSSRVRDHDDAA